MKRLFSLIAVLMIAAPLFALDRTTPVDPPDARQRLSVVDEVIRMSTAGVGDDAIISYIRESRESFAVTSDDLIALTNARVSDRVVRELQADAQRQDGRRYATQSRVLVSPYVYGYPYYPYSYYSPFYSPYFYGPRLSFGIVIGPRFGGFRHRW